jgi:hypothetical protein
VPLLLHVHEEVLRVRVYEVAVGAPVLIDLPPDVVDQLDAVVRVELCSKFY